MLQKFLSYSSIALVKEIESPENPGGLEKRVAIIPNDVGLLVKSGIKIFVECGAGEGVGFSDEEYIKNNAIMQTANEIYKDKSLIIKFKGPALDSIMQMKEGCTLFCMAHFHSYPDRAKLLQDKKINVIAMEEICESPKQDSDIRILGRVAMKHALKPFITSNSMDNLHVRVIGWSERLRGAVNRSGNRNAASLQVIQPPQAFEDLDVYGENTLYFYDSKSFDFSQNILNKLRTLKTHIFDLHTYEKKYGDQAILNYKSDHPPAEFGLRRIQCLHETGQSGARYGMSLLSKESKFNVKNLKAVVLGYGNVGQGAIDELHQHGINSIHILGRTHTAKDVIVPFLKDADIIINGAEQPAELRGKNFLITNQHIKELIPEHSVIIDLVGGSPTNRSPVEAVLSCSFLTKPYFVQDGVLISALWGWPMMGMMRETAIRYSGQIVDILIGPEKLINGLGELKPGVERALVCGPF